MKHTVILTDLTPEQQRRVLILYLKTTWTSPFSAIGDQETVYYKDRATSKAWDEHGRTLQTGDRVILRHGDNQCTIIHDGLDAEDIESTFRSSVITKMVTPQNDRGTNG